VRHLTSIRELTKDAAISLLDNAQQLSQVNDREVKKLPALRGKTVVNLFFENSTRTRISFEVAAKRLSADVINFSANSSSVSKGESLKDTAQTLEALGADAIVIRHPLSGAPKLLAEQDWISASVINAGDGSHEHPTQALLDALTIRQGFGLSQDLSGLKVLIVGDILHSRVARSNILLLNLLGANVTVAGPGTLIPAGIEKMGTTVNNSFEDALSAKPDVVMMLRVQKERMQGEFFSSTADYSKAWSLEGDRLEMVGKDA
jgi:aspartate carbamoyltransferase catalytic subunit